MSGDERVEKYLSEAQPHSQGEFSWDALRMAGLLSLYAELDPYSYVLHCLAAAVAGQATFFHIRVRGTSTLLSWDGQPVSAAEVERLGPQGDTRQAALALALYASARLGRVHLTVAGGSLEFQPRVGWRSHPSRGLGNQLEVTLSQWWLAFAPSQALARLRSAGRYAPLTLNLKLPAAIPMGWAVRWGEPARLPCNPSEWVSLPASSEWGVGCAFPGQGSWTMVVDGVGYPVSGGWPQLDVVWWGSFPLDLERARLVEGEQLQAWKIWLALQLSPVTGQRRWPGVPLDILLEHGGDEVWKSLWYERADGRAACLDDLQAYYDRWGFLPVVGIPGEREAFLFAEGFPSELQELFPNWAYLPERYPRLPDDEEYLVRVPLASGDGEIGLRANPGYGQRIWTEQGWAWQDRKPHGVDWSVSSPRDYLGALVLVYTCLLEMDRNRPASGTFHLLCFVDYLMLTRNMRAIFDPIQLAHPNPTYGQLDLSDLVAKYPVHMLSGEQRSVLEVADRWVGYLDLNSPKGFICDFLALEMLRAMNPLKALYQLRSRRCQRLVEHGTGPLLERLRSDPECAAYQVLQLLPDLRPAQDMVISEARKELGQGSVILTTFHLLLALSSGRDRVYLLEVLPDWLEVENLADLADIESLCKDDLRQVWLWGKTECLLRCQRWNQAAECCQEMDATFPGHWQTACLKGLLAGFRGDYEEAYRCLERALERGGPRWMVQPHLWRAALLSGRRLAETVLVDRPLGAVSSLLAVSLNPSPNARADLCDRLLSDPHCPASVHEVLGEALAELGHAEAARRSWRLFLAARHDQLMEFDLAARQARVRDKLDPP